MRRSTSNGFDQDQPSGGAPEGVTGTGRHAARAARPQRPRPFGRRRWLVVAAAAAAFTGMVSPPPHSGALDADVEDAAAEQDVVPGLPQLSAGAPAGSIVLASAPVHDPDPEPATPAAITGLAANGIPNVALNAYRLAAARMASAQPSCGIDWSLLAGIGRVESNHGRYGGAVLNSDGTATPRILGPALDGVQFAYIADSDGGQWDDDTRYDRAMGPMQFIPTTWRAYAIDADGDGETDPFNINDAALAAANYLCTAGGNLRTVAGQRAAVFAYNHSDSYVNQVLALAHAYASGIPVADLPIVGPTTGDVPAPDWSGIPAAPGPAIGAGDRTTSPPDQTVGAAPPAGQSGGQPAGSGSPSGGAPSGGAPSGGQPATSGDGGSAPAPAPAPAPAQPAPAPAPAPAQPAPSNPLPVPVPPPPAPRPRAPTRSRCPIPTRRPSSWNGVTCNVSGDLIADLPGLPACP